jgi:hypothetical protein
MTVAAPRESRKAGRGEGDYAFSPFSLGIFSGVTPRSRSQFSSASFAMSRMRSPVSTFATLIRFINSVGISTLRSVIFSSRTAVGFFAAMREAYRDGLYTCKGRLLD